MSPLKKHQLNEEIEVCIGKLRQVNGLGVIEIDPERLFKLIIGINQHLSPFRCHYDSEDYCCGSE